MNSVATIISGLMAAAKRCGAGMRLPWAACLLALCCGANLALAARDPDLSRVIGIEGDVAVTLARGDYQPRPLDDRTPLILRVEKITPVAGSGQFTYELHYIGFEPGDYRLADYLIHPDGSLATEIGGELLHVRSTLPPNHDGTLNPYLPRPFPWFGGYRMFLGFLALLWVGGIAAFIFFGRKKQVFVVPVVVAPPPTFAERMRPLVEAAAAGYLAADGQAELERLMTGYWRDKLALPDQRMAAALTELKRHPEAGALLRALERWLHRPGGATREEVAGLLEPYRQLSAPTATGEVAA
ncbi:MAG: hypothetical protein NTW21_20255 [Verrucomicrobia bacterium]|nr:hypothetical protein [Verrucomicrobiota bacterium]